MSADEKVAAIRPGVRYRVTFEGVASEDMHPNAVQFRTADAWHPIVGAASIVDVQEITAPLPMTPGSRFWGRTHGTDPQWFAVRPCDADDPACRAVYVALQRPISGRHFDIHQDSDVEDFGLVRLPDPEVTP